jgi:hypothetical protein
MTTRPTNVRPANAALLAALVVFVSTSAFSTFGAKGQETGAEGPSTEETFAAGNANPVKQPIAFSHAHHVGEVGIDCQFCHAYARRGPVAGIPSVQRCAGCHEVVLSERPEIVKVLTYWKNEEPIPWVRVHDLPDHVRFSHKPHIRAGVNCSDCHGDVETMEAAVQVESLSMGWCLDCHKEREASRDCLICHY